MVGVADSYIQIVSGICQLGTIEGEDLEKFVYNVADGLEKVRVSII